MYWCAIKGIGVAKAIAGVFPNGAELRDPEDEDAFDHCQAAFARDGWAFVVAPEDIFDVAQMFPDREVVKLHNLEAHSWATLESWRKGELAWSVYGAAEDDYVRVEGKVPAALDALVGATVNCDTIPALAGELLTGFHHETHHRPAGMRIVEAKQGCELRLPGNEVIQRPSWVRVSTAVEHVRATAGAWLGLTIGEGSQAKTLRVRHAFDGSFVLEYGGASRPIEAATVAAVVATYYKTGKKP